MAPARIAAAWTPTPSWSRRRRRWRAMAGRLQAGQVFYFKVNPQRHKAIRYGS